MFEYPFDVFHPFCLIGEYEDGEIVLACGDSAEECFETLWNKQYKELGKLITCEGYQGNGYVNGEYVGETEEERICRLLCDIIRNDELEMFFEG